MSSMRATGYVHPVADGEITTLRQFALRCARGMGATIMMRDDPLDAPIPERFEPHTDYHDKALAEARETMDRVLEMNDAEADEAAAVEYADKLRQHVAYQSHAEEQMRRCKEMLGRVEVWTTEAEGLKEFMVEQLMMSIGDGRVHAMDEPVRKTAPMWRADKLAKASRDLAYHEVERNKEIARTESRNRWLSALRDSLPPEAKVVSQ